MSFSWCCVDSDRHLRRRFWHTIFNYLNPLCVLSAIRVFHFCFITLRKFHCGQAEMWLISTCQLASGVCILQPDASLMQLKYLLRCQEIQQHNNWHFLIIKTTIFLKRYISHHTLYSSICYYQPQILNYLHTYFIIVAPLISMLQLLAFAQRRTCLLPLQST